MGFKLMISLFYLISMLCRCIMAATTPCGTNIFGSYGEIEYKLNKVFVPEEICVWIITTPSASRFDFTKEESNFKSRNRDTTLTVYTFDKDGMIGAGELGQINARQHLYLEGSAAIVVFSAGAGNNMGKGFRLTYSSRGSSEYTWDVPLVAANQSGVFSYEVEMMNRGFMNGPDPGKKLSILVVPRRRLRRPDEYGVGVQIKENIQTGTCAEGRTLVKFYSSSVMKKEVPANIYNYEGCNENRLVPQYASDLIICFFGFRGTYRSGGTNTIVYWEIY